VPVFGATACLGHDMGPGHPESPERLAGVRRELSTTGLGWREAAPATIDQLVSCHPRAHLESIRTLASQGGGDLDPDTRVGPASWQAIMAAAGAALAALDHALATGENAFAAIRPPGHHALASQAMGFCFVGHAAVLAARAHAAGVARVLIVDWDVHHGNGTQSLVEHDPATRFVSMHQWPWYPGSGAADERGAAGNCWNLPMPAGLPRASYVEALWEGISAATRSWQPELVIISAGYDGMAGDPLGGFTLEPADYAEWTARLRQQFADAPLVAVLEGGYLPSRLAAGVLATVAALR
jgi:acetoin utilization deacetylase AcuC-like enzyme